MQWLSLWRIGDTRRPVLYQKQLSKWLASKIDKGYYFFQVLLVSDIKLIIFGTVNIQYRYNFIIADNRYNDL